MQHLILTATVCLLVAAQPAAAQAQGRVTENAHVSTPTVAKTPHGPVSPADRWQPASSSAPRTEAPESTHWYGGYTLLADGLALGVAILGAAFEVDAVAGVAAGGYLLGAPIVHAANGQWLRSAFSLGLRASIPFALIRLGIMLEDCEGQDFCGLRSFIVGGALGTLIAVVIDATVLARRVVREPVAVQPAVSIGRDSAWLGARVAF